MGETIKILGADGFEFSAYHETAFTPRKGGVVVLQEIFGVDQHVRADVTRWAKAGYDAVAPALFDRRQRDFHADHDPAGLQAGIAHARATPLEQAISDIAACREFLERHHAQKVCVVGYCYGGSLAWLTACQLEGIAAAASYYGSLVQANAALEPKCPVVVHLGRTDPGIPADEVERTLHQHHPDLPVHIYDGAGHGFNNESPERYNAEAADLARHRTLKLFEKA
jgi:carboxymethylenebutenolidase